jgi:hypothetical protein
MHGALPSLIVNKKPECFKKIFLFSKGKEVAAEADSATIAATI